MASDRAAELDSEGQVALLRQALTADPEFLPAALEYVGLTAFRRDLRDAYQRSAAARNTAFFRCIAIVAGAPTGYPAGIVPELLALERRHEAGNCTAVFLALVANELTPARVWTTRSIEYTRRATAAAPSVDEFWIRRASLLLRSGRVEAARGLVREGLQHALHAMQRIGLYNMLAGVDAAAGEPQRAFELRRALAAAVQRDGRPGILWFYPEYLRYFVPVTSKMPAWELAARERVRLTSAAHDAWREWPARRTLGSGLSDAGKPAEALPHLDRAVHLADSLGSPLMRLDSYRFRGRTYAKLGRFADAEHELQRAIRVGRSAREPYFLAEAYHNLAHTYEGMGRMADAARMIDRFVELTQPLTHAQPRMMSLHDAGIIRWKAGWPAAANAAFDELVRVVDEQERGDYWAAEHFEHIGDFNRALHYYQRGAEVDDGERSLNLGGLTRMFQQLGQIDSAELAARAHDSTMSNQLDVPLLPAILATNGRSREALEIARSWADKQLKQGNLQGGAMATAALADLLLGSGDARHALAEAAAAESLARRGNFTDELIRARRLEGLSRLQLGDSAGLGVLRQAAALAETHATVEGTLLTQLALADALAGHARWEEALAAYDLAARAVEGVAARLDRDEDRARFRDHQLMAFDGAMEVLLQQPASPARMAGLVAWSQRRKAAALALAAGVPAFSGSQGAAHLLTLDGLRRRLSSGSALIDYLTLRGKSVALVVTSQRTEVIVLPMSPDTIRGLADGLRRPLVRAYAGRLDLARAPFDLAGAHALYQALLAPIESLLGNVEHLFVVPDGPLHYVPFEALVRSLPPNPAEPAAYSRATYLVDRFELELLPSAQFLPQAEAARRPFVSKTSRVLVVNRDAPGGAQEVAGIRAAWPAGVVSVLEGDAATETAVRESAGRFTVLHFATHAEADDREPLASHLRLAGDAANDGFLQLGEIAAEHRPARLVVLSACETMSGRLYRGEGLMGLARAFLAGGAEAVVATQWPVGPDAAKLMGEFHHALAAGLEAAPALRAARLALRRQLTTSHPFFWAGFVLVRGASEPGFATAARAMARVGPGRTN